VVKNLIFTTLLLLFIDKYLDLFPYLFCKDFIFYSKLSIPPNLKKNYLS
jgi:hypothetical protein